MAVDAVGQVPADAAQRSTPLTTLLPRRYHARIVKALSHGSYSLGQAALQLNRLRCDKCGRFGQYQTDRLLEQYGLDIAAPDLRHELAQCPHRRDVSSPCQVEYVDRLADRRLGLALPKTV
jgi:hypothetical protein